MSRPCSGMLSSRKGHHNSDISMWEICDDDPSTCGRRDEQQDGGATHYNEHRHDSHDEQQQQRRVSMRGRGHLGEGLDEQHVRTDARMRSERLAIHNQQWFKSSERCCQHHVGSQSKRRLRSASVDCRDHHEGHDDQPFYNSRASSGMLGSRKGHHVMEEAQHASHDGLHQDVGDVSGPVTDVLAVSHSRLQMGVLALAVADGDSSTYESHTHPNLCVDLSPALDHIARTGKLPTAELRGCQQKGRSPSLLVQLTQPGTVTGLKYLNTALVIPGGPPTFVMNGPTSFE